MEAAKAYCSATGSRRVPAEIQTRISPICPSACWTAWRCAPRPRVELGCGAGGLSRGSCGDWAKAVSWSASTAPRGC